MKDLIEYKGYHGSVHFDDQDLIFFGKICFVKALISYEATDAKGLKKAFQEAVDDYLEMCQQENISPETPFKGSLNVRLGNELHRNIAIAAQHQKISINKYITKTLERAVYREI